MALTKHEKHHLDAMVLEISGNKVQPVEVHARLAPSKGIAIEDYIAYLDAIDVEVQKILDSGIFPAGLEPSDIHDHLEK